VSESLYRDLLLDHMRHPRFAGKVEPADRTASAYNPLCGDELELTLALTGDCIREARAQVRGCSVCVASASMMGELIQGVSLSQATTYGTLFREAMSSGELSSDAIASLRPLLEIRKHKSRVKCALLAWNALEGCLKNSETTT
jgi:nitrogen fixation NifU-like protein|tara:strand:+ start:1683 stop:2111 length:429 start_codon:yes stop_codon:yes gene_type:complete